MRQASTPTHSGPRAAGRDTGRLPLEEEQLRAEFDEFAELVYSDDQWVQAEFDALITAAWPTPPRTPGPGVTGPPTRFPHLPGPGHGRVWPAAEPPWPHRDPRRPGTGGWGRQRSPPPTPSP